MGGFKEWKKSHNIKGEYYHSKLSEPVVDASTYNCKCKVYPDGMKNFFYAPTDLYGRSCNYRFYPEKKKSLLDIYLSEQYEKNKILDLQYERDKLLKQIDVFYKSVDNYLLFLDQSRKFDKHLIDDHMIWTGFDLDSADRSFLNSLDVVIRSDNLKRAKDSVYDYVYSNNWDWFFTGTIDPKKIDSSDPLALKKPLQKWFNHMVDRYGISYIIIFERHKKTDGIHIHGLIKENPFFPLRLKKSDTRSFYGFKKPMKQRTAAKHGLDWSKGRDVYNLMTWRFGWSTAIKTYGSRGALTNYITKYITKDNEKIMGRYFWHSRDLQKPTIQYSNVNYEDMKFPIYHGWKFNLVLPENIKEMNELCDYTEWTDIL